MGQGNVEQREGHFGLAFRQVLYEYEFMFII